MQERNLIYDGSFDGFLSTVFLVFEQKLDLVNIQRKSAVQNGLFASNETVITEETKAVRVWKGLKDKLAHGGTSQVYYSFLSERPGIENLLLDYIRYAFKRTSDITKDYSHPTVLKIAQITKMVAREKHRMEAFVRFKLTKDAIYFANIAPDFDVLPIIMNHFKTRYADQKWIIYDIKRKYGIYYDLNTAEIIDIELPVNFNFSESDKNYFVEEEFEFERLWKDYFKSTNIKSRKNLSLHIRHVPKRYWKYLSEKQ